VVTLDLGRRAGAELTRVLVPLLTMSQQAALRLQALRALDRGLPMSSRAHHPVAKGADVELRCLGPFRLRRGGKPVPDEAFTRRQALTVLKILALRVGDPVPKDYLIELLWPGVDAQSGANRLHGVIHALRSALEPVEAKRRWRYVRTRDDLYYLDVDGSLAIDLVAFRDHARRGLAAAAVGSDDAIVHLEAAAALYEGDLFTDDPYAEWCAEDRRELQALHVRVLQRLARLHAEHGDADEAVTRLEEALRHAPLRDDLVSELADLYTAFGRSADARRLKREHERELAALE
jgi:DNA-binding SARP family transcriptional activator